MPNSNFPSYDCSDIDQPVAEFRVQDTPFGFDWDVQEKFPGAFKGALFIGKKSIDRKSESSLFFW